MKTPAFPTVAALQVAFLFALAAPAGAEPVPLFDGKTLDGWESREKEQWRIEEGAIVAGDGERKIPSNYFLFTEKEYGDFEFRCRFKLTGDPATGMINSGIQFRSEHRSDGHASGYQADIGDPGWWGCIYDEHRRDRVIAQSDMAKINPVLKREDWNEYVIRCEGARSRLWINGVLTVDYTEPDAGIARTGKIAVQIHSGGAAKVAFKDLTVEELAPVAAFGRQVSAEGITHSFLITGPKTALIGEDNAILWEAPEGSRDGAVLANGNLLIAHANAAREYTRDGKVVWEYQLSPENGELERATRLEGGVTMIVELGGKPRVLEVDAEGKVVRETPLQPETDNTHMQTRMVRKLPNGNYLAPHLLAFAVKEYEPSGKVVQTIATDLDELGGRAAENWPFTAIRLANGNTLVNLTHGNKAVEFDAGGKVAWKIDNDDVGGRLADPCGAQRLPNGNTVICSYGQQDPAKPRLLEVTPDKKVVWEYFNDTVGAHEVHVLSTNGAPVEGEPLR